MLVSTKGRYALRVMVDLAEHQGDRYIPLKEIAERQEISEKYLETILKVLVQEKMLVGLRGKGGGYKLSRPPEQYTVGSIIRLTEGSLAPVSCLEKNAAPCSRASVCRTLPMWQRFNEVMNEFFDGYTIADLMWSGQDGDDYVI
ncbi:MAG: RrF2 family transcriptional regulator [Oscillospiraceae bacterium]|nr:RrF2 family transcriptional regulator [Oscillospiraceae bacterium]MCD8254330.1 RrF2 family transcriptional regulator [Oscillospiraceae bacterium]